MGKENRIDRLEPRQVRTVGCADAMVQRPVDRRSTVLGVASPARLVRLAAHLPERDRALIRAIYADGVPLRVVATVRGESERECRRVLGRLVRRVNSPEFAVSVRSGARLSRRAAAVARACFVEGLTMRDAAARLGIGVYDVRRERGRVLALVQWMKVSERPARPSVGTQREREAA